MTEATLLVVVLILMFMSAMALFAMIIGGCLMYQFGIKLREYKPRAFLIEDINSGIYRVQQNPDGTVEIVPRKEEKDDVLAEDPEEALKWMYGVR